MLFHVAVDYTEMGIADIGLSETNGMQTQQLHAVNNLKESNRTELVNKQHIFLTSPKRVTTMTP